MKLDEVRKDIEMLSARRIAHAAEVIAIRDGKTVPVKGGGPILVARVKKIGIAYITSKEAGVPSPPLLGNYGVKIWIEPDEDVFEAWWEPFKIQVFKQGDWVREILPDATTPTGET